MTHSFIFVNEPLLLNCILGIRLSIRRIEGGGYYLWGAEALWSGGWGICRVSQNDYRRGGMSVSPPSQAESSKDFLQIPRRHKIYYSDRQ